jgi:hypothetical protein
MADRHRSGEKDRLRRLGLLALTSLLLTVVGLFALPGPADRSTNPAVHELTAHRAELAEYLELESTGR